MNTSFQLLVESLETKYQQLIAMEPIIAEKVPLDTPIGGVYLFSDNSAALYAGRTKRKIGMRIRNHFSSAKDCPFAWLLTREITQQFATYRKEGSRRDLISRPEFSSVYEESKARIRKMNVRYVQEQGPLKQALLEIYVAVASQARYNDFGTS